MKKIGNALEALHFSEIDVHFARFLKKLAGEDSPMLFSTAALASRAVQEGHVCLDLSAIAGRRVLFENGEWVCPELPVWVHYLKESGVVGEPGEYFPLILDSSCRLYLYRYWDYENRLADELRKRAETTRTLGSEPSFRSALASLLPDTTAEETDRRKVAAFMALTRSICVISGGPGTGKSTLIAKILAITLQQNGNPEGFRIALCAPTGKAATRMQEAIKRVREGLPTAEEIKEAIPTEASTIHRLLSSVSGSPYFRHSRENPLHADLVVVDESSMVDVALMSKLVQALRPDAALILLGDANQLSSVEAGAVLGDLCNRGSAVGFSKDFRIRYEAATGENLKGVPNESEGQAFQDCVVQLRKSYRFGADSGIGTLSQAINLGDGRLALELLKGGRMDIAWRPLPSPAALQRALREIVLRAYRGYAHVAPEEFFPLLEKFHILCALRRGPFGVSALNDIAEKILRAAGAADPGNKWYAGRPVMITSNHYGLGLFNGDIGAILPDTNSNGQMRGFFLSEEGSLKRVQPFRLPEHETAYAMTVHKSQGSEFDDILLILPDRDSPVLTRELLYTAVTRARERVEIWGTETVFLEAVNRRILRTSGLRDALWGPPA